MEYSYYRDARHHYLTIPCEAVETYQYRMLAANRMEALLPCTIRSVDGRRYLYYDITARENMEEFFRGHGSASAEIPRLLYAIADAGAVLERYLLDCCRILLAPEFVYYDYTRGEFAFLYYPEDPEVPSGPAFYEYLADHADPQDKMLYYTLLRLISISANQTYVLDEAFLEHSLGRKRPESMTPGTLESLSSRSRYAAEARAYELEGAEGRESAYGIGDIGRRPLPDGDPFEAALDEDPGDDAAQAGRGRAGIGAGGRGRRRGRQLILSLVLAVLLLAGAIGLALARVYVPMDEVWSRAAMAGMIVCLVGSILIAVYGVWRGVRSRGMELDDVRENLRQERRNALAPVEEFR